MSRLIRNINFATRDEEGAILVAFTQTGLRNTWPSAVPRRRCSG
jgi:hypothetical protein